MIEDKYIQEVHQKLQTKKFVLCTVESCTGGLISHLMTNFSGASQLFWGSYVVYDNSAKASLGVSPTLIQTHGAVSAQVAQELANQGLKKMQAALGKTGSYSISAHQPLICLSTTGIAGPTGGNKEKPVGLCYIGLATSQTTLVEEFHASQLGNRIEIKMQFALKALQLLSDHLSHK